MAIDRTAMETLTAFAPVLGAMLPRRCLPPIWRELDGLAGFPRMGARPPLRREGARPVLLIPGFLAGDSSLAPLGDELARRGHAVWSAGIACNVDCSERTVDRLQARLREAAHEGGPVAVVGHSRGGLIGRVLARREPELVSGVITLGTPHRDQLAVHPLVWAQALGIAALGHLGVPGLFGFGCTRHGCCRRFAEDLAAPVAGMPLVSIYSRRDGIVNWRACIDPDAVNVRVASTHCRMPRDAAVVELVTRALAGLVRSP